MKTRKRGILGRLSRNARETKKANEVAVKPTEVDHTSEEDTSSAIPNLGEGHPGHTLSGISEDLQSSISSDSNVTSASDLMKCLNSLRIQEASITNSTSTPSVASVPRLAPPPRLLQSDPKDMTDLTQTWPRLDPVSNGQSNSTKATQNESKSKQSHSVSSNPWIAFPTEVKTGSEEGQSSVGGLVKSVSLHARGSSCVSEIPTLPENKTNQTSIQEESKFPLRSAFQNHWRDSDEEEPIEGQFPSHSVEVNPFAEPSIQQESTEGGTLFSKTQEESNFDCVLRKYGTPGLELIETVDVCFSGNKITKYEVWGEVKFKLSGNTATPGQLSPTAIDCLEVYRFMLRLKCVLQHVFLKKIIVKQSLMEWDEFQQSRSLNEGSLNRTSSLSMNEARKGIVESKIMQWNLAKCYQEALTNPVTLMKYPAQVSALSGPPLLVQLHWQRPKRPGLPVLVDVVLLPNRRLTTSLWGVTVCLKGFGKHKNNNKFQVKEALASPEAKWNSLDCCFEWLIPIINPEDSARHLKVKVSEDQAEVSEYDLSTSIKFVMPHSTLSGTLLLAWIEPRYEAESEVLFGDEKEKRSFVNRPETAMNGQIDTDSNLVFCERMCLTGEYEANTNY